MSCCEAPRQPVLRPQRRSACLNEVQSRPELRTGCTCCSLGEQSGREVCLQHQWRDCCASRSAGSGLLFTKNWENDFCRASELG